MSEPSEALGSGLLSDAMDALGLSGQAAGGFQLTHPDTVVCGRAFTLRQERIENMPDGVARHGDIAEYHLSPGDVLVISVPDGVEVATWGEGHALRALGSKAAGVVIDGATRDVSALTKMHLPVMYRSATPLRSKGRLVTADVGGTLVIGGVRITGGDLVCFDADGLAVVPAVEEAHVRAKAAEIQQWEAERNARLRQRL